MALSDAVKERIKLRSTYLNNIAVGIILLGSVSSLLSAAKGEMDIGKIAFLLPVVCIAVSFGLHLIAVVWLGELDHDV